VETKAHVNFSKLCNAECGVSTCSGLQTLWNGKFWYTLHKCTSFNYLESPLIIVKSLVTARHHTMVSFFLSSRPAVIRCIACPDSTFQIRTTSADPVTITSPVASHARHKIRPIKIATQFQHLQNVKLQSDVIRNNTAETIHHFPHKINLNIY
jgi:gluconate kinase